MGNMVQLVYFAFIKKKEAGGGGGGVVPIGKKGDIGSD